MTTSRKRRKPKQVVKLLQECEAMLATSKSLAAVYQKLSFTESTWAGCTRQYGGMKSDEARLLHDLEMKIQKFKELLAEAELETRILKEVLEVNY